jgi:hypothetical protein
VSLASWVGLFPAVAVPPPSFPQRDAVPGSRAPQPPAPLEGVAGRAPARRGTWLSAGLHAAAPGGVVPGLSVAVERLPRGVGLRLGWRLAALASTPRHVALAGGTSSWIRPGVLAGLVLGRNVGAVDVDATVGAVGGLAVAWGSGYPMNKRAAAVDGGPTAALRLGAAGMGRSKPWLEVAAIGWIGAQRLRVDAANGGTPASVDLPRWEVLVSIGWSFELP